MCIVNGDLKRDEVRSYKLIGHSKAWHEIEKYKIEEVIGSNHLPMEIFWKKRVKKEIYEYKVVIDWSNEGINKYREKRRNKSQKSGFMKTIQHSTFFALSGTVWQTSEVQFLDQISFKQVTHFWKSLDWCVCKIVTTETAMTK